MKPTFPIEMEMVGFALQRKGCTHPIICQSVRGEPFDKLRTGPSNHERTFDGL